MTRKKAEALCDANESPLDVMVDNMLFWFRQSHNLQEKLEQLSKVDELTPDERIGAMKLVQHFLDARNNAQKCAVDAAPYVHPKLQSIALTGAGGKGPIQLITTNMTPQQAAEAYANTLSATKEEIAAANAG